MDGDAGSDGVMSLPGWIKLYRMLLEKPIWKKSTPEQKVVLIALLLLANRSEAEWEWKGRKFKTEPGQFVTSLEKIRKACGSGISIRNVRTALERFEKLEFLTNQSCETGRVIGIVNWKEYQGQPDEDDKVTDKEASENRQRPDKDLTTNKKNKNVENHREGSIYTPEFERFWGLYPRKVEKQRAFKVWQTRLKHGAKPEDIMLATQRYADHCRARGTEIEYIKHPSTFIGPSEPYKDWLEGGHAPGSSRRRNRESDDDWLIEK